MVRIDRSSVCRTDPDAGGATARLRIGLIQHRLLVAIGGQHHDTARISAVLARQQNNPVLCTGGEPERHKNGKGTPDHCDTSTMNRVPRTPRIEVSVRSFMASGLCLAIWPETTAKEPLSTFVSNALRGWSD